LHAGGLIEREKFEKMKDEYYAAKGWDENGVPTLEKLVELRLQDVADDLKKSGHLKQEP
jgi:aldehyde:ferredoxin oxidoreductase